MAALARILAFASILLSAAPASATCSGASLEREYREADVVARVHVAAETRVAEEDPSPAFIARWGEYTPIILHGLRVLEVFKGRPGPSIEMFQEIASGRIEVDLGQDYLLFLTYYPPRPDMGSAVRGTMYVRYTCGQSKLWSEVAPADLARLRTLSRRR